MTREGFGHIESVWDVATTEQQAYVRLHSNRLVRETLEAAPGQWLSVWEVSFSHPLMSVDTISTEMGALQDHGLVSVRGVGRSRKARFDANDRD